MEVSSLITETILGVYCIEEHDVHIDVGKAKWSTGQVTCFSRTMLLIIFLYRYCIGFSGVKCYISPIL